MQNTSDNMNDFKKNKGRVRFQSEIQKQRDNNSKYENKEQRFELQIENLRRNMD